MLKKTKIIFASLSLFMALNSSMVVKADSGEVDLTNFNEGINAFTIENPDGNDKWDYGTKSEGFASKSVWSYYYHRDKVHGSSCRIGYVWDQKENYKAGTTSLAFKTGIIGASTAAYWTTYGK